MVAGVGVSEIGGKEEEQEGRRDDLAIEQAEAMDRRGVRMSQASIRLPMSPPFLCISSAKYCFSLNIPRGGAEL